MYQHNLDITSVTDREEIAAAFGEAAAWRAVIVRLKAREAREKNPQRKRKLPQRAPVPQPTGHASSV